ncbi:glycosyl transferase family 1 [Geojedonia litorea]|uniref:Glycosyl transferase family 1 n=1 Tax=Geojedonia litorea TaxID=1268269 RepID=A0ABV9N125_9FLAO
MSNRVLIITYYWPPAGGPGVQRWLKFVKYLPDFGIEPIVYCPENPSYPITDKNLEYEVSKTVRVLKQPIKEPYRWANLIAGKSSKKISSGVIPKQKKQTWLERFMLYVRGNFFIPDARKNWIKPSVSFLENYITQHRIGTIITTGPPHSLHLIGLQLKNKLNVNWITDFRDPWTTIGYHKALKLTKRSQEKHHKMELEVLNSADQIIVTSKVTKREFQLKTKKPITVITNGFDNHKVSRPEKDQKFTLSHIGSLLADRNPSQLWQAIRELIDEVDAFKNAFQLNLFGVVSEDVLSSIKKNGLGDLVKIHGYVSYNEAIKAQMSSRVLLLIEIDSEDTKAIIPGKLFEYMAAETPILAVGPRDSDVEDILKQTNTGHYFYYNQKEAIKTQIALYFEAYQTNNLQVHPIGLKPFSRRELTSKLSKIILTN